MTLLGWLRQSALAGLGAAVALVLALTAALEGSVSDDLVAQQRQREAVLLTQAIAASLAGADAAAARERLRRWQGGSPAVASVRVVVGRELLASTVADDAAPRALRREEKPLFDLATLLRSAAETNRSEGAVRKKTLQIDEPRGAAPVVTVPLGVDGRFEGIVQARIRPQSGAAVSGGGWGLRLAVLALALVLGAALPLRPGARVDLGRVAALLALALLAIGFQQHRLAQQGASREASEQSMLAVQQRAAVLYAHSGAPALDAAAASPWDTDAYGRPLRHMSVGGRPLVHAEAAKDLPTRFLERSLWLVDALGLAVLLFFTQGFAARTAHALREHASAYAYVAPAMVGMLVLVFFPFFYGIGLSFTDTTLFNEALPLRERWIGLDNFVAILGDFNLVSRGAEGSVWNYQNFYWTLMVTVIWTISNVTVGVSVGFVLALALNTEGLRGKAVYRVLLILPWAIPNYITALVWRGMFHPQFGVINQMLQMAGFKPVAWFDGVVSAFMTGLVTNGWLSFPFMMVVILGALQSIPKDMYEAAEVEGATRWQQLRGITLPLLRPTLVPAVVLSVVWTFNMFNIIFLVSGGEPGGANEILITKAYKIAFEQYQYAYAAAYSTVIFIILLVYGYFQTRVTRATESY